MKKLKEQISGLKNKQAGAEQLPADAKEWRAKAEETELQLSKEKLARENAESGLAKEQDARKRLEEELKQALTVQQALREKVEALEQPQVDVEELQRQFAQEKSRRIALEEAGQNNEWVRRIAEIQKKLEQERERRTALENALVKLEMDNQQNGGQDKPQQANPAQEAEFAERRIRQEREREGIVKGFLRQGTEAERQGKTEAARWNYQKTLELDPENPLALKRLGLLAVSAGDDQTAVKYLKQAFLFSPDDLDTLMNLGYCQARLGEAYWAVSTLGRAVALNRKNVDVRRSYGTVLMTLGWTQAAEKELMAATELKPEDGETAFNLAVLLASSQPPRLDEARKWYLDALKNGAQNDPGLDQVLLPKKVE